MDRQKTGLAVLARIPDLNHGEHHARADEAKGGGLLRSGGRLIGQTMSIKLLAGMTLFLLVGAVLPCYIGRNSTPATSSPTEDALTQWEPKSQQTSPDVAPGQTETSPLTVARRPAVRIPAIAESSSAPAALPSMVEAKSKPPAIPTVAESLMMSKWVDPQLAKTGVEPSPSGADRPTAARSTEYQADARAGYQPREPEAARFEGTIEEPGTRNRYDSTRPSIH